jgi:hypothetical protein
MDPYQSYNNPAPMPGMMYAQGAPTTYAHGGRVRKKSLTLAHMSPSELHVLDHLQGGTERHNKSGVRSYSHLEELLNNPHIRANVHHHAREHHAMGGDAGMSPAEVHHMAHYGRGGDTEMALIGPHTHHLFNAMAGYSTRNPHDGHPEYFNLKGTLGGLWNSIKGAGSTIGQGLQYIAPHAKELGKAALPYLGQIGEAALPTLGNIATEKLGDKYGDFGKAVGEIGTGAIGQGLKRYNASHTVQPSAATTGIGQGIGNYALARNEGQGHKSAVGSSLAQAGQNLGPNNNLGGALSNVGLGMQMNHAKKDIAKNSLLSGLGGQVSPHQREAYENRQAMQELPFSNSDMHGLFG